MNLRRFSVSLPSLTVLLWPLVMLVAFFAVPMCLLVRVSLAPHDETGLWLPGLSLDPYGELLSVELLRAFIYSVILAFVVAATSLLIGLPFAYFISRMQRRAQVIWLVFLMATLSLSEVLVAFAWQVMLSKRVGLSDLLVTLGIMRYPDSLSPGNTAVIACLTYLVIPFTVMILYPGLSRIEPEILEASRMLGASPWQSFRSVTLPLMRGPVISAFIMAAIMTLGSYVTPMVLGKPQFWTVAILISQTALNSEDLPGAAAMALVLLLVTGVMILGTARLGNRRGAA